MKKSYHKNILYLFVFLIFAFVFFIETSNKAVASSGPCGDAAEMGVCIGNGAKCDIKKGWFTFSCGKDPNGDSIIIQE